MDRAERAPIPAPGCSTGVYECLQNDATATQIRQGTLSWLYTASSDGWLSGALLANAIYNASFHNDASPFAAVTIPEADTSYSASYYLANIAISCQDDAHDSSPSDMRWRELM